MHEDKVSRLRKIMADALPNAPVNPAVPHNASHAYQLFQFNQATRQVLQTPRARAEREVVRIAAWYDWSSEVLRAMDRAEASTLSQLDDLELHSLLEHLRQLEDCVHQGFDSPLSPPAR